VSSKSDILGLEEATSLGAVFCLLLLLDGGNFGDFIAFSCARRRLKIQIKTSINIKDTLVVTPISGQNGHCVGKSAIGTGSATNFASELTYHLDSSP